MSHSAGPPHTLIQSTLPFPNIYPRVRGFATTNMRLSSMKRGVPSPRYRTLGTARIRCDKGQPTIQQMQLAAIPNI